MRSATFAKRYRTLIATWWGSLHGCSESEISRAEARLGVKLPGVLREHYRICSNMPEVCEADNKLHAPFELTLEHDALVIAEEHQVVVVWGIPKAQLRRVDPPVDQRVPKEEAEWHRESDHLSEFLFKMAYWHAANGGLPHTGWAGMTPRLFPAIESNYKSVDVGNPQDFRIYADDRAILCVMRDLGSEELARRMGEAPGEQYLLSVGARQEVDLLSVERKLGIKIDLG